MQHLLAKVAKGQKTSKDLTWEEAKQAMRLMIEGTATPAQVGAFLIAMRFKSESVTELAAFTATARQYVPAVPVRAGLGVVDVPVYAGKRRNVSRDHSGGNCRGSRRGSVAAAWSGRASGSTWYLVRAETRGHSGRYDCQVGRGRTGKEGVRIFGPGAVSPAGVPVSRNAAGIGGAEFLPSGSQNAQPARATSQVIGLSHPPYFEKTIEALRMLSCPRALVIRGVEGDPELSIGNSTRLLELKDERITPFTFQPKDAGLTMATFREMAGFPVEQREREADLIKRLLANEVQGGQRDWVLLNAAMLLYAAGKGTSISGNLEMARRALESGQAKAKLAELVAVAGSDAGAAQKVGISA